LSKGRAARKSRVANLRNQILSKIVSVVTEHVDRIDDTEVPRLLKQHRIRTDLALSRVSPGLCPADVEILLGLWEYGYMKTTLELPDGLMQRVRLRAVHRNQKLKDAIAQLLELGMAASPDAGKSPRAPKPVRLKSGCVDIGDIEAAIAAGRE
jgi:hypothetical protein